MSLKFFHVLFIAVSTVMAIGVGVWAVNAWQANGMVQWLAFAVFAFLSGAALVVYGNRFLKKARKLGIAGLLIAGSMALPKAALACPACAAGNTDSILRSGMNNGILALLGITGFMLACFAMFMIYLVRRARRAQGSAAEVPGSPFEVRVREGSI